MLKVYCKINFIVFFLFILMIVKNQAITLPTPPLKTIMQFKTLTSHIPEARDYVVGPHDFIIFSQPRSRSEYLTYLMNMRISADVMHELLSPFAPFSHRHLYSNLHPESPDLFTQSDVADFFRLSFSKSCISPKGEKFFRRSSVPFGFKLFLFHLEGMSLTGMLREYSMVERDKLKVIFLRRLQHVESTISLLEGVMMDRFYFLFSSDVSAELLPHNEDNVKQLTGLSLLHCVEQEFNRRDLERGVKEGLLTFIEVDSSDLIDKEQQTIHSIQTFLEAKPVSAEKILDPKTRKTMTVKVMYKPKEARGNWPLSDRIENSEQFLREALVLNQRWRSYSTQKLNGVLQDIGRVFLNITATDADIALCHNHIDQELKQLLVS